MKDICGNKAREIKEKVGERREKGMSSKRRKKMEGRKEIKRKERKRKELLSRAGQPAQTRQRSTSD